MTFGVKSGSLLSLVGGAILGALVAAAPSTAADMAPAYKAAAMPAPAYNWSGFYGGVTAGGGMASLPVTDMDSSSCHRQLSERTGPEVRRRGWRPPRWLQLAVRALVPGRHRRRFQLVELQSQRHELLRRLRRSY